MATHLTDFYSIPELYDVLHQPGTAAEVRALERMCREWCAPPAAGRARVWLEPACGSGRLLRAAARRGHRVIGFDLEPAMIAYAQARARAEAVPNHRVFVADMSDFASRLRAGSVDFAFNPINSVRHIASDAALGRHLLQTAAVLKPGGVYAVGISLCAYGFEQDSEDIWRGRGRGVRVEQVVQYLPAEGGTGRDRFERVISHLTVRRGREERHIDSAYRLRGYNLMQWRRAIARAGLEVVGVVDQDGRATPAVEPGYAFWILRPGSARGGVIRGGSRGRAAAGARSPAAGRPAARRG